MNTPVKKSSKGLATVRRSSTPEAVRQANVRAGFGKYAFVPTSSEEFSRRKVEEIELEEHTKRNGAE